MNKKNKLIIILFSLFLMTGLYAYFLLSRSSFINMKEVSPVLKISAAEISEHYLEDEKKSDSMYKGKVLEIKGIIKKINFLNNRNTLILQGYNTYSNIICDIQNVNKKEFDKLELGDKINLKGICKGFLKDVIILNCVLVNK
ncbi:hypothetical protein A8C32_15285 [Flavivirga aquatica]|uniref:tRNA_anti-like n=1 Tax=Flavivirga aquatica TaxID=1849968 RepID=A0A1E5T8Z1_9FLAO|nr:hypothetical protein A8C32_15285 [Flavivirga aquatica]